METLRKCCRCRSITPPLIYVGEQGEARPLFYEEGNLTSKILFVAEAPNYDDTLDPSKGRLTVDPETDPSGRFFHHCITKQLGYKTEDIMVTNSVLCLPAAHKGKFPVRAALRRACSKNLRTIIDRVDPFVVVPLGGEALNALKLIERHRLKLSDSVAIPHQWYNRILFPLYHPGLLGRITRKAEQQMQDFKSLRMLLESLDGGR